MPWKTKEGSFSSPDCEQEAECYEQAADGRKWPITEASVSTCVWEWLHETTNKYCELYTCWLLSSTWTNSSSLINIT